MNFLTGRIEPGPAPAFRHDAVRVPLDPARARPLDPVRDGPVVLGVRPEDVALTGDAGFPAGVEVVEQMGNEVIVYLRLGENALVARVPPQSAPQPGQAVNVAFRLDRVHFFDARTEETLV
jgi:multiple sugar transport system ATP-binding protein